MKLLSAFVLCVVRTVQVAQLYVMPMLIHWHNKFAADIDRSQINKLGYLLMFYAKKTNTKRNTRRQVRYLGV